MKWKKENGGCDDAKEVIIGGGRKFRVDNAALAREADAAAAAADTHATNKPTLALAPPLRGAHARPRLLRRPAHSYQGRAS